MTQRHPNLVREHFTLKGRPKRAFATIAEAAEWRKWRGPKSKGIYLCTICDSYHLGGARLGRED